MRRLVWGIFIGFITWICLTEVLIYVSGSIFSFFDLWEKTGWQANHRIISLPVRLITISFYLISGIVAGIFAVKISNDKKNALFLGIVIFSITLLFQSLSFYFGLFFYFEYLLIPLLTFPAVLLGGKIAKTNKDINLL